MRVVLDTNVVISALVFPGGKPESVYRLGLEGKITLVTSSALLAELAGVLIDRFGWEPSLVEDAVAQLSRIAEIVEPKQEVRIIEADSDDNRVLEAAFEGAATRIVSGDRHLLSLCTWEEISILTPAAFLDEELWSGKGNPQD